MTNRYSINSLVINSINSLVILTLTREEEALGHSPLTPHLADTPGCPPLSLRKFFHLRSTP